MRKKRNNDLQLTIGWLYPDLMSTYGDRGNIIVLEKRANWRGIKVIINKISLESSEEQIRKSDFIFMGGAQDKQQEIVNKDLLNKKGKALVEVLNKGKPGLFICGAYQFLGKYYKAADGTLIKGLAVFDLYTENPGLKYKRLIGDLIIDACLPDDRKSLIRLVGFENHGGRTYLTDQNCAFGRVVSGYGNNGKDKTEGIIYKNTIGTYLHGPLLPKNPQLIDFLIEKALLVKYGKKIKLYQMKDLIEQKAKEVIFKRYL